MPEHHLWLQVHTCPLLYKQSMIADVRAIIFDVYGTLFDVHSVASRASQGIGGDIQALSNLWRQKQIEYTWRLALMERYRGFREVTESALRASLGQLRIAATEAQIEQLMHAYDSPSVFGEVRPALERLKEVPLAILSNGTPEMIDSAVANAGLASAFACIISADRIRTYKPSPRVYALGPEMLGIPAPGILFVSSNSWDAAGAKAYGYQVCWCNRSGAPSDDLGFAADFTIKSLDQLTRT